MPKYYNKRFKKRGPENPRLEDQVVGNIAKIIWIILSLPFRSFKKKDSQTLERWSQIQELVAREDPTAWMSAILKADTLLNDTLKSRFAGETLGERLKNSRARLAPEIYDAAWQAHILRNKIAHEHVEINRGQVDKAIVQFRTVLNHLGVL